MVHTRGQLKGKRSGPVSSPYDVATEEESLKIQGSKFTIESFLKSTGKF